MQHVGPRIGGLLDDADTAPNAQEIDTYAGLRASLDAQLAAWDALKKDQVLAFCANVGEHDTPTRACPERSGLTFGIIG